MSATFVIAQGGGPTAVINQTLVGAVLEAKKRLVDESGRLKRVPDALVGELAAGDRSQVFIYRFAEGHRFARGYRFARGRCGAVLFGRGHG